MQHLLHKNCTAILCHSGTEELGHAVQVLRSSLQGSQLLAQDITPSLISSCCYTRDSPPVDLLVRSSGEHRLSDFLLWQCRFAMLHWVPCLWPDLSYVDFLGSLLAWQRSSGALQRLRVLGGDVAIATEGLVGGFGGKAAGDEECHESTSSSVRSSSSSSSSNSSSCNSGSQNYNTVGEGGGLSTSTASVSSTSPWHSWLLWGSNCNNGAGGGSPEHAGSRSLSSISEGGPCCCPHPNQGLRLEGFLRDLLAGDHKWLEQKAAVH